MSKKHVTDESQFEMLNGYEDLLKSGYSMHYYFVVTGSISDRIKEFCASRQSDLIRDEPAVSFDVFDFASLKEFCIEAETLEQNIPESVEFQLPQGSFTIKNKPYKTFLQS